MHKSEIFLFWAKNPSFAHQPARFLLCPSRRVARSRIPPTTSSQCARGVRSATHRALRRHLTPTSMASRSSTWPRKPRRTAKKMAAGRSAALSSAQIVTPRMGPSCAAGTVGGAVRDSRYVCSVVQINVIKGWPECGFSSSNL